MECYLAQNGGGASLNFKVIGNPMPSTAKENTIWIDTDVPITSYIFSATQPTGVPGMVWISTDTSSTVAFNALKKNGIMVYPFSAKQYVSGAWVDKTAKIWQGGEWVDWVLKLVGEGVDVASVLGGWVPARGESGTTTYGVNNADGTVTVVRNANSPIEGVKNINSIDWSKYTWMEITVSDVSAGGITYFGPGKIGSANYPEASVSMSKVGTYTLDISSINEEYPLHCYMSYSGTNVTISEITLYP